MRPDWEGKAERLLQGLISGKNMPYVLEIHPTFRCNLHCVFCQQEYDRKHGREDSSDEMEIPCWLEIIDEAARKGIPEVRVCGGGEPMYNPRVSMQLFRRIKKHGMIGYLTTNGTMFTEDTCREIVNLGWDKIEFSVDGANVETHDALRRVPGCFKRTLGAIQKICALKREAGQNEPFIIINFVVTSRNFQELPALVELFGPSGVNQILLLDLHPGGEAGNSLVLTPGKRASLWESIQSAKVLAQRYGMKFSDDILLANKSRDGPEVVPTRFQQEEQDPQDFSPSSASEEKEKLVRFILSPCYEPWYYLQVLHDGTYSPCCNSYIDRCAESFHEANLEELWLKGKHITKVRNDLMRGVFEGGCKKCDAVNVVQTQRIRHYLLGLCEDWELLSPEEVKSIRDLAGSILPEEE